MSRSYRKSPVVSDLQYMDGTRSAKRHATKAVRKSKEVANGNSYKKHYDSWKICDYKSYWPDMPAKYRRK